ncbi:MAG: Helicase associated domain protein, partial [Acidimicrobiia bacterium]|nr:Helicase associated domain protein [Acidimicrobiia bacterium]
MPQLDMLLTRLDADSNVRGRQFERICEWYLTHDPAYRRQLQRVWLWAEWPQRAGPDTGIDLVAEDKQGHLWAIQAKAYSPDHTVTKRDIDTFLSASSTLEFSFRLLIATTDRIGANAKRTIEGQEKPVHLHMLTDLQHAEIEWPADPSDLHAPRPPIKSPRPHQQEAIDAAARGFEGHDRGQLIMACGTGKTLTALWITEHLQSNRTLVLVPSLSLLKDTLRAWTAQTSTHFAFLPVCSDSTVRGSDEWVSSTTELGFPVTTDPDEIATFMGQDGPLVVFSTYQSSPRIAEAQSSGAVPEFNLVIADEAHRVTGPVSSDFATILDSSAIRAGRRLFATATPRYFTDRIREEAGEADFELASMDNTAMFGPVFHRLPFGEAIERDLLSDYQVAIIGVDDRVCRQLAERGVFVRRDGAEVTDARTLASHIGLAKAMRDFDLRKTISFHSRINRAREFADDFVDVVEWIPQDQRPVGELVTSHVSGKMTAGQRHLRIRQLDQLEDTQRGLLSNARCLGEGIDVPTLDGVAFIDPRSSQIDIIQAVGRAIRKAENKTFGTIILPVFIDKNEDPDTALSSSVFKPIWTVLKALRSHDDDLAEQLDQLRRQLGRRQTITRPHKIHVDLPKHVSQAFAHAFEVRLIESSTASWEMWFALLEDYVDREGHANVPAQYVVEGRQLGQWCSHQRRHYTTGRLPEERITRLNALGFLWEPFRAAWEEGFAKLEAFVEREGHALAEHDHIEDGYKLGKWCSHQRSSYTQGKLAGERIARLEALGFVWNKPAAAWEKGFDCLAQFVAREGHAVVADDYIEDGYKLGLWGSNQRRSYTAGRLSEERISRLEALGFVWDLIEAAWEEGFCNLRAFVEREGHANVSSGHLEDDYRLGQWCSQQRKSYTQGKLTGERI